MNNFKASNPTPYQGKKRCFGEFACQNCGKNWKSANSKANTPQECTRCHNFVFPSKQSSLDNVFKELRNNRDLKFAYLQQITKETQLNKDKLYEKSTFQDNFMENGPSTATFSYQIDEFASVSPASSISSCNSNNSSFFIKPNPITAFDFQDFFSGICRF